MLSMIFKSYPVEVTEVDGELLESLTLVLYPSLPRSDIDITLGKFPESDNKSPLKRFRSSLSSLASGPEGCFQIKSPFQHTSDSIYRRILVYKCFKELMIHAS